MTVALSRKTSLREKTFREVGQRLGKDPNTVSKEVRRNLTRVRPKDFGKLRNICTKRQTCSVQGLCSRYRSCLVDLCRYCATVHCTERCLEFEPRLCPKLKRHPMSATVVRAFVSASELKQVYHARLAERPTVRRLASRGRGLILPTLKLRNRIC